MSGKLGSQREKAVNWGAKTVGVGKGNVMRRES